MASQTFYSDEYNNPTTARSGFTGGSDESSWATAHGLSSGDDWGNSYIIKVGIRTFSPGANITRSFLLFDTSDLVGLGTIRSATLSVPLRLSSIGPHVIDPSQFPTSNNWCNVIGGVTPASNTTLTGADFDQCGAITNPIEISDRVDISDMNLDVYGSEFVIINYIINDLSYVDPTGITKLGFREGNDCLNIEPGGSVVNILEISTSILIFSVAPSLTVVYGDPPNDPTNLVAISSGDNTTTASLSWDDNSDDEEDFLIELSPNGTDSWFQIGSTLTDINSYIADAGDFDVPGYFRVRAAKDSDTTFSNYTNVAFVITSPATPTDIALEEGSTAITLAWIDVSTSADNVSIERKTGMGSFSVIATVATGDQTYSDSTVSEDVDYTYRIRATRSSDDINSGYSDEVVGRLSSKAPIDMTAFPVSATTKIDLSWTDVATDESSYSIERSDDGDSGWTVIHTTAPNVSFYEDNVGSNDSKRYYRVRAARTSDSSFSDYSNIVSATTAPAKPTDLAVNRSGNALTLTWLNSSSTNTEFRVERARGDEVPFQIAVVSPASFNDSNIYPEYTYVYRVRSYRSDDQMYSLYSDEFVSNGSEASAVLTFFGGCINEENANSTVQLIWRSTNTSDQSYKIERSDDNSTWSDLVTLSSDQNQYLDEGLNFDTVYYYRLSNIVDNTVQNTTSPIVVKTKKGNPGALALDFLHKTRNFPS